MTDAASTMKISKPSITLKNRINHFSCIAHIVHHIDHFLIENYDYTPPGSFIGKVGKQLREFDDRIGLMMNALESLSIADNTFVMFTSDNDPDGSGFANQDYASHVRFGTFGG